MSAPKLVWLQFGQKGTMWSMKTSWRCDFYTPFLSVPEQTGGQVLTHKFPTNFISGCAQAKWCKEAGIECSLQRRLWERVVTCDFATNAYAVYHWGAQPSPCQSKKEIGYLCSGSWTFLFFWYSQSYWGGLSSWPLGETIREFTNFEPVAVCFSDHHTLSASLCISLVTLVRAVSFPSFHVLGQCACLLGNRVRKKRLVCVHLWIAMFPRLPHAEFNLYGVHEFCVFRKKKLQLMQGSKRWNGN